MSKTKIVEQGAIARFICSVMLVVGLVAVGLGVTAQAAAAEIQVAFSSRGDAEDLVLSTIRDAKRTLHLAAYSLTSKSVAVALADAHRRGVKVQVVADKSQLSERYSVVNFLANHGIPVRIDREHAIQHNKFVVADKLTVQTGSLNYTASAMGRNAENVIVIEDFDTATQYLMEWEGHWRHAEPLSARY